MTLLNDVSENLSPGASPAAFDPRLLIKNELARRCEKNPRYSLRAFARGMGVSHTVLSLVLSGKRSLSKKAAAKIADFLGLDPVQREGLLASRRAGAPAPRQEDQQQASLDAFAVSSDWHHRAIMTLLDLPGTPASRELDARWIAQRLNLPEMQVQVAIERLQRLGLIARNEKGEWARSAKSFETDGPFSAEPSRKYDRQLLEKAIESLENDSHGRRSVSSVSFVMDASRLEHARTRILALQRELAQELERLGTPSDVYQLTIQLCPVTRPQLKSGSDRGDQ